MSVDLVSMTIGDYLSGYIMDGGKSFIEARFEGLGFNIATVIRSSLLCSLTIYGIKFMMGEMASSGKQMLTTFVWVLLAMGVTTGDFYMAWVFDTIFEVKGNLASYLMYGSGDWTIYQSFSLANSKMFLHGMNLFKAASFYDVFQWASATAIFIIFGLYYFLFIAITLYCDFALCILILLGAIIIPISGFQSARGLMKSWVVAVIKYCAVFVVVGVIVSLLNVISTDLIGELMFSIYAKGDLNNSIESASQEQYMLFGGVLILGCFGVYLLLQAMEFATEMTGGVMSNGAQGATALVSSIKAGSNAASGGIKALKMAKKLNTGQ